MIEAEKDEIKGISLDNLALPSHKSYLVITWDFHIYFFTPRLFFLIAEEAGGISQKCRCFLPIGCVAGGHPLPGFDTKLWGMWLLQMFPAEDTSLQQTPDGRTCFAITHLALDIFSQIHCTARGRDVLFQIYPKHSISTIYCCFCV